MLWTLPTRSPVTARSTPPGFLWESSLDFVEEWTRVQWEPAPSHTLLLAWVRHLDVVGWWEHRWVSWKANMSTLSESMASKEEETQKLCESW